MLNWPPFYFLPLRYSILRLPSSECHELLSKWSMVLTSGLYSQPDFRSGIHLHMVSMNLINKKYSYLLLLALSVEFLSQPYWWPTTVPTNQVLLAELKYQNIENTKSDFECYITCNKCSFLPHLVCTQVCHCSCPPFCIHQEHRLGAF